MNGNCTVTFANPFINTYTVSPNWKRVEFGNSTFILTKGKETKAAFEPSKHLAALFTLKPNEPAPTVKKDAGFLQADALLFLSLREEGKPEFLRLAAAYNFTPIHCKRARIGLGKQVA